MVDWPSEHRLSGRWRDQTFLDDLRSAVQTHPAKPAVVARRVSDSSTRTLSYAELAQLTERCAVALAEMGLEPGDFVAVQLTNKWEITPLFFGCLRAGVRLCPLVPMYRRRELRTMLGLTEARAFITMAELYGEPSGRQAMELAAELPALEHVLVADGPAPEGARCFEDFFFGTAWEDQRTPPLDRREFGPDDPFLVLFTSGTTGEPKGVLHSQNTLFAAIRGEADRFGLDESLVMAAASVCTHYTGFVQGMLMPLMLRGTMVFPDTLGGPAVLDLIEDQGITFLYAAPPFLRDLRDVQRASPRNVSSLKWLVSGSSPVPPQFVDEVRDDFGVRLHALWGMTENGPVTITRPADPQDWAAHSDGSPIAGMEVRIDPMPGQPDGTGRLWVRGAAQCLGYFRRDDLYSSRLDADGWFDTGDLARPDGRGGIRITGRVSDILLHHAFIVPTPEIEALIERHPKVREVALVGLPDGDGDEAMCAVVAPYGETVTLAEIREHLRDAGAMEWYWPDRVEMMQALPKTPTGKVLKSRLKKQFAGV